MDEIDFVADEPAAGRLETLGRLFCALAPLALTIDPAPAWTWAP